MYKAIVTRLKDVRPHPNADRVQLATCHENQVVVGLDNKEDELGVYFSSDGQLSHEFCYNNDLYRDALLNKHPEEKPGMFDNNRRVRTQKFRGEISDGFWVPLHYFSFIGEYTDLNSEGFEFNEWKGIPICSKYINFATSEVAHENKEKKTKTAKKSIMFKEHFDTGHVGPNLHRFGKGQYIIITEKVHGCVSMNTLVETLEMGKITIGEIVDKKLELKIKALDIETNKIIFVPIDNWFFKEDDGEWYEIELEDGRILEITGNNPVWLPDLKCYRAVENLIEGEMLLVD